MIYLTLTHIEIGFNVDPIYKNSSIRFLF